MEPSDREIEELLARARETSERNFVPPPEPRQPRRVVATRLVVQALVLALLLTLAVLLVLGAFGMLGGIW